MGRAHVGEGVQPGPCRVTEIAMRVFYFILCISNTNGTLNDVRLKFIGFIQNDSPLGKL